MFVPWINTGPFGAVLASCAPDHNFGTRPSTMSKREADFDRRYMRYGICFILTARDRSCTFLTQISRSLLIPQLSQHHLALDRDKSQIPPKPLVRVGLAILRGVNSIQNSIVPAPMRIADLSFGGYTLAEVVRTAAALGIADKLAQGPMTAEALAEDIGMLVHGLALCAPDMHPTPLLW